MKIQIDYFSIDDNAETVALGLKSTLSNEEVEAFDLRQTDPPIDADVYLIGFNAHSNAMPLKILDLLERIEGKMILLFVTTKTHLDERFNEFFSKKFEPFISSDCNYLGAYLFDADTDEEIVKTATLKIKEALDISI